MRFLLVSVKGSPARMRTHRQRSREWTIGTGIKMY